jgi:hypothetical protein
MEQKFYQKQWFKKALDTTIVVGFLATLSVGASKYSGLNDANDKLNDAKTQYNSAAIVKLEYEKQKNEDWAPWLLGAGAFFLSQYYRSKKN